MKKLDYWEAVDYYKVKEEAVSIYDIWVDWHNKSKFSAIQKLLKNKKYQIVCQLQYYLQYVVKENNYGSKVIDIKEFEEFLNTEITIWRGGRGIYDKDYQYSRKWTSFTANKERLETFSVYNGTYASRQWILDKNEHYWQVELKIPLRNILLYQDVMDAEVIVSVEDARNSILIGKK